MIIIPLDATFGRHTFEEQREIIAELQQRGGEAKLRGKVVAVWPGGFTAPQPWHPFFRTFSV